MFISSSSSSSSSVGIMVIIISVIIISSSSSSSIVKKREDVPRETPRGMADTVLVWLNQLTSAKHRSELGPRWP